MIRLELKHYKRKANYKNSEKPQKRLKVKKIV